MTGDGGEYLRAEDLRELGDDSLPGHYLDFSYMNNMNIDRYKNTGGRCLHQHHQHRHTSADINIGVALLQVTTHPPAPKLPPEGRILHRRRAHEPPGERRLDPFCWTSVGSL